MSYIDSELRSISGNETNNPDCSRCNSNDCHWYLIGPIKDCPAFRHPVPLSESYPRKLRELKQSLVVIKNKALSLPVTRKLSAFAWGVAAGEGGYLVIQNGIETPEKIQANLFVGVLAVGVARLCEDLQQYKELGEPVFTNLLRPYANLISPRTNNRRFG
jgi:hypothetical protein